MKIKTVLICNETKIHHMSEDSKRELKNQDHEEMKEESHQLELQESHIQDEKYDESEE